MAPPKHRRPGFSRRAQYGLFLGYVVAIAGTVAGTGLVLIAHLDPPGFAILRGAFLDLGASVSATSRAGVRAGAALVDGADAYYRAASQNHAMRRELEVARARLLAARTTEFENRRLRQLVRLVAIAPQHIVTTRVIGSTVTSSRRLATIGAGSLAGVRLGQPVRSAEGLVGRVVEVGHFAARVMLLTDGGSVVPVRIVRNGAAALAAGRGDGAIDLRPLGAGANPFRRGDLVVSSGVGGIFPPDVPVAVVTRLANDGAVAWPIADPARLDFAIVENVFQPPAPAAAAP